MRERYIEGSFWVKSIKIDALNSTLDIELIADPETQKIDGRIHFTEIIKYKGMYHEADSFSNFDKNCLPFLLGILFLNTNKGDEYTITTDTVEIILVTKRQPELLLSMD